MNRKNLKLLADYLWGLPDDYGRFDMNIFQTVGYKPSDAYTECNTAACALGHSPYVEGLPDPLEGDSWKDYSKRIFDLDPDLLLGWGWCFSGQWSVVDNTPKGAAKRIYYLLNLNGEKDLPDFLFATKDVALLYQDMNPSV